MFGAELATLAQWETSPRPLQRALVHGVLRSLFGTEHDGLAWQADVGRALLCGHVSTGELRTERVRRAEQTGVKMLEWLVRMLGELRRRGTQIRATGSIVFQGHHYEPTRKPPRPLSFAEEAMLEHDGLPVPPAARAKRRYCNMVRAGGIAARVRRSPRTLYRYARVWEQAGILDSEQPDHKATDAVRPRAGDWAYKQWWTPRALPRHTLRRLRESWGEAIGARRRKLTTETALVPSVARAPHPHSHAPRSEPVSAGPPDDTPAERAALAAEVLASLRAMRDGA